MSDTERLRDAAYATSIDPATWDRAVAGYYGGPGAYHVWEPGDWKRFTRHKKLPIWVPATGDKNGTADGHAAVAALAALGVPAHVWTVLDMELMVDRTYVEAFGRVLNAAGYKVWVYGSASTVFKNPQLDGYWVADYKEIGAYMYKTAGNVEIRATQYASPGTGSGGPWDSSTVAEFTFHERPRWWI